MVGVFFPERLTVLLEPSRYATPPWLPEGLRQETSFLSSSLFLLASLPPSPSHYHCRRYLARYLCWALPKELCILEHLQSSQQPCQVGTPVIPIFQMRNKEAK